MSADNVVRLFPAADLTRTVGELIDDADNIPARKLRQRMLEAAAQAGQFPSLEAKPGSPEYQAELRQWVTLGALITRYLFDDGKGKIPGARNVRI
jgi:hypothetical protein